MLRRKTAWITAARRALPLLAVGLLSLGAATPARAQGIQALIDRAEATVEDRLALRLVVTGSRNARPELPELPDFQVFSRGQSQQVSIVNGNMTSNVTHTYLLVPARPGSFTIGPAAVEIDGKTYRSQPIQVRILDASQQPQASRDIFVQARVSTRKPYVGQQVTYTWQLLRRINIADARLEPMEFDGFVVEDLGEVREYQTTLNGQQYAVSEIRKALFPQEDGTVEIPPTVMTCEVLVRSGRRRGGLFDDFFGRTTSQSKVLRSQPIQLEVRPLPPAPRGFSGLIGDFDLKASLSQRELKVGESTSLKLTVSGSGNVQMIGEPAVGDLSRFKIYDDRPVSSINRKGNTLRGSKIFNKALVPQEAGDLSIPAIRLVYFDPEDEIYRTATAGDIDLLVSPADGEEDIGLTEALTPTRGKVIVRILADDILPIYKGLDAVARPALGGVRNAVWLGGFALPPLLYLGLWLGQRRRHRFASDVALRRRKGALRGFQKNLAQIQEAAASGDSAEATQRASRCLREYIGDKLAVEGSALTPAETAQHLEVLGLEGDLISRTRTLLTRFEAAQYAPQASSDAANLTPEVEGLVKELERGLPS